MYHNVNTYYQEPKPYIRTVQPQKGIAGFGRNVRHMSIQARALKMVGFGAKKTAKVWIPCAGIYIGVHTIQERVERKYQEFKEWLDQHVIGKLTIDPESLKYMIKFVHDNPAAVRLVSDAVLSHVDAVPQEVIKLVFDCRSNNSYEVARSLIPHVDKIRPQTLEVVLVHHGELRNDFIDEAAKRIEFIERDALAVIIKNDPEAALACAHAACNKINKVSWPVLELLMQKNAQAESLFLSSAWAHIASMNWSVMSKLLAYNDRLARTLGWFLRKVKYK